MPEATTDAGVPLESLLRRVPFFSDLDRVEIARLVGALEEMEIAAGEAVVLEGEQADGLYLLAEGTVQVSLQAEGGERELARQEAPHHFGELGLLLDRRTSSVRALTDLKLWKLPRDRFDRLVRERPTLALAVATAALRMMEQRQRHEHGAPPLPIPDQRPLTVELPSGRRPLAWRLAGGVGAIVVPVALWGLPPPGGLSVSGWHVVAIGLGATVAWLLEPLPDFVIALLMAAAWGVTGLATLRDALNGIGDSIWFLVLGAMAVAAAMSRSGLMYRVGLLLLRVFPRHHPGQLVALLAGGILLTPLVPLSLSRVAAAAPLSREMSEALGYPTRSRASASLAFTGILGYGVFGSVFLSGLVTNFFVYGLLPAGQRARFDWLHWLAAAAPTGALLLGAGMAVLSIAFRPEVRPRVTQAALARQRLVLGRLSRAEWITLAALAVLVIGLVLEPTLHVEIAWIAVLALAVALAGGGLSAESFRGSIDWGFLIFFGVLWGTSSVLRHHQVDTWLAGSLVPLAHAIGNPALLVLLIALVVIAIRHTLPWFPEVILISLALVPHAHELGLSPWVVGFVILLAAEASPSDQLRVTREVVRGELFTDGQARRMSWLLTAALLAAIAASLPYWWLTGLLTHA